MTKVEEFEANKKTATQLRNVTQDFATAVAGSDCDKKGIGFNKDDRFSAFQIRLSFDSWRGYYGNSGCSTVINFSNTELVKDKLVKYLNRHYAEIFKDIADRIDEENIENAKKAKDELLKRLEAVEKVVGIDK